MHVSDDTFSLTTQGLIPGRLCKTKCQYHLTMSVGVVLFLFIDKFTLIVNIALIKVKLCMGRTCDINGSINND